MASFPGQPGYATTRMVKTRWVLMKQKMMGVAVALAGAYANHLHLAPDNDEITSNHSIFLQARCSS